MELRHAGDQAGVIVVMWEGPCHCMRGDCPLKPWGGGLKSGCWGLGWVHVDPRKKHEVAWVMMKGSHLSREVPLGGVKVVRLG